MLASVQTEKATTSTSSNIATVALITAAMERNEAQLYIILLIWDVKVITSYDKSPS